MHWLEILAIVVALAGIFAGAFLVSQRPTFWIGLGTVLFKAALPAIIRVVTKRMPPKEEADWRKAEAQGRGDEWLKQRWRKRK